MKYCTYLAIALSLTMLTACNNNEPTMAYNPCLSEESPKPDELFNLLQGKWQLTESCTDCATAGFTQLRENNHFLTFKRDSTIQIRNNISTLLSQKFIIASSYSEPPQYFISVQNSTNGVYGIEGILSVCNDKLVFFSFGSNRPTYVYTKQPN